MVNAIRIEGVSGRGLRVLAAVRRIHRAKGLVGRGQRGTEYEENKEYEGGAGKGVCN